MVHPEIQKTLDAHVQAIRNLGNGNFGLRNGFLVPDLSITTSYAGSGDLVIRNAVLMHGWDCGRTAFRVGEELKRKGFQVRYRFAKGQEGSIQNYVEALDPETTEWVKVDATPWYEQLNPGYAEAGEHPMPTEAVYARAILSNGGGPMLSVEKQPDGLFIESYIGGGYRSSSDKLQELEAALAATKRGETLVEKKKPQYTLKLWSKLCRSIVDTTLDAVEITVEVLDSERMYLAREKMQGTWREKPEEALELLVQEGIAQLKVRDYSEIMGKRKEGKKQGSDANPMNGLAYLDVLAGESPARENLVRNVRTNLGALANVVLHLEERLRTEDGKAEINVKTGMVIQHTFQGYKIHKIHAQDLLRTKA